MFGQLTDALSGSAWAYVLVFHVVAGDALLPLLPGETMVVAGGVLAGSGDLLLPLVILAGAIGAFAGDNLSYWIGRKLGSRGARRLLRGERGKRSVEWAQRTLDQRGGMLIAVARFVPGGRTAVTFTAGSTDYAWRRFAVADGIGALIWSAYNAVLGTIGGRAFEKQPWKGLLLALGLALLSTAVIEGVRWLVKRRAKAKAPAA